MRQLLHPRFPPACSLGKCRAQVWLAGCWFCQFHEQACPIALAKLTKKISAIVYITTIGAYISSPWFFGAAALAGPIKSVDFLSIATVMLTLAGLSLGKDIPLLKNIGWKIIPVGLVAVTASFLLSTVIAEFALGLWH